MNRTSALRTLCQWTGILLLVGCASAPAVNNAGTPEHEPEAAVQQPVTDPQAPGREFDFMPREIDPQLVDALRYPYRTPAPLDCATISTTVEALDAALGPDLDDPELLPHKDYTATRLLLSGVKSAIPYFGWVRRLSGADRRQRLAESAFAAGQTRRGYLKGLGQQLGCTSPAAPVPESREPDPAGAAAEHLH